MEIQYKLKQNLCNSNNLESQFLIWPPLFYNCLREAFCKNLSAFIILSVLTETPSPESMKEPPLVVAVDTYLSSDHFHTCIWRLRPKTIPNLDSSLRKICCHWFSGQFLCKLYNNFPQEWLLDSHLSTETVVWGVRFIFQTWMKQLRIASSIRFCILFFKDQKKNFPVVTRVIGQYQPNSKSSGASVKSECLLPNSLTRSELKP